MTALSNFPMLNQRTTTTSDGQLDINRDWDCVAESIAAAMSWYTGKLFIGGVLKELIYGTKYQGGTAATAYVQYCMQHGVKLYSLQGDNATLVQLAHQQIQANHPVMLTEIDPYIDLSLYPGSTHVVCAYEESPSEITVMDPFGGFPVSKSDAQWARDLQFGEIWVFEPIVSEEQVAISLSTPGVGNYFKQAPNAANVWQCITPGHPYVIGGAINTFYRTLGNSGLCGLTILGLPTSNEYKLNVAGHPEIVQQDFERGSVVYDPGHAYDNPPGAGIVYLKHQEITNDQVKQAVAKVIDLQHKLATIEQVIQS